MQKISIPHTLKGSGLDIPGGGGSQRPKNLKESMKLNWNFQRGGGGGSWRKSLSWGEVWIFSGTTNSRRGKGGCVPRLKRLVLPQDSA